MFHDDEMRVHKAWGGIASGIAMIIIGLFVFFQTDKILKVEPSRASQPTPISPTPLEYTRTFGKGLAILGDGMLVISGITIFGLTYRP